VSVVTDLDGQQPIGLQVDPSSGRFEIHGLGEGGILAGEVRPYHSLSTADSALRCIIAIVPLVA